MYTAQKSQVPDFEKVHNALLEKFADSKNAFDFWYAVDFATHDKCSERMWSRAVGYICDLAARRDEITDRLSYLPFETEEDYLAGFYETMEAVANMNIEQGLENGWIELFEAEALELMYAPFTRTGQTEVDKV